MNENPNPYAAPAVSVVESSSDEAADNLIHNGRRVSLEQGTAWIGAGWRLFTQSPMMWILNFVILVAINICLGFIPLLGNMIGNFLTPLFAAGLVLAAHGMMKGRPIEVGDLFQAFSSPEAKSLAILGGLYLAAMLTLAIIGILLLIAIAGMSISLSALMSASPTQIFSMLFGGTIVAILMVTAIVLAIALPISMAFWFAPALVVVGKLSPSAALSASFIGCLKNFLPFLIYGLIFLVLFIVGAIPFMLGLLVVVPLLITSSYAAFRDIYLGQELG